MTPGAPPRGHTGASPELKSSTKSRSESSSSAAGNTGPVTPPVVEKPKTFLCPITERFTPKGCFDTLKKVERVGLEDDINDEVNYRMTNRIEQKEEHAYIGALLRGLENITRISTNPMAEILRDCSLDSDKEKYEDRINNCF